MSNKDKVTRLRTNITLTPDAMEYLDEISTKEGLSRSTYIQMLLNQDKRSREALSKMGDVPKILDEIQSLLETQRTNENLIMLNKK